MSRPDGLPGPEGPPTLMPCHCEGRAPLGPLDCQVPDPRAFLVARVGTGARHRAGQWLERPRQARGPQATRVDKCSQTQSLQPQQESKAAVTQEKWVVGRAACCGRDLGGREQPSTHLSLHPAVVSRLHPPPQHLDRLAPGCQTLSFSFGSKTPRRTKPQVQVSRTSGGGHEPSPQPLPGSRATNTREDKAL